MENAIDGGQYKAGIPPACVIISSCQTEDVPEDNAASGKDSISSIRDTAVAASCGWHSER